MRSSIREQAPLGILLLLGLWSIATMTLWGFAFFHAPGVTPEWLLRAQAACFGTGESGLPDTYGWTVLILAPLSMLAAIFVSFRYEIDEGFSYIRGTRGWRSISILLVVLVIGESIWIAGRIRSGLGVINTSYNSVDSGGLPEHYARQFKPAPNFKLVDQSGGNVSLSEFKGNSVFLSFFFAHCKTVCPVLVKTMQEASERTGGKIPLLMITLDPWRDTPRDLPSLAEAWGFKGNQKVLSGDIESVNGVIKNFEVPTDRSDKDGNIVHPALVYVIGPGGEIAYSFNNPPASWLVDAVARLEGEERNP